MAVDPICGMTVDPLKSLKSEHKGIAVYFCSARCKTTFDREPEAHIPGP